MGAGVRGAHQTSSRSRDLSVVSSLDYQSVIQLLTKGTNQTPIFVDDEERKSVKGDSSEPRADSVLKVSHTFIVPSFVTSTFVSCVTRVEGGGVPSVSSSYVGRFDRKCGEVEV